MSNTNLQHLTNPNFKSGLIKYFTDNIGFDLSDDKLRTSNETINIEIGNQTYPIQIVAQLTDENLQNFSDQLTDKPAKINDQYRQYLICCYDFAPLDKMPSRSLLAGINRELSRKFDSISGMPTIVVFRYVVDNQSYCTFTIPNLRDTANAHSGKYIVNKIVLLKDINLSDTHPAHLIILEDLNLQSGYKSFDQMHENWLNVLSKDKLNKDFYADIVGFYERLINDQSTVINPYNDKNHTQKGAVRLLLRVLFIWFLEQKKEVILTNDNQSITQWLTNEPTNIHHQLEDLFYNALKNPENTSQYWSKSKYLNSSLFQKIDSMGDNFATLITDNWFWTDSEIKDFDGDKHGIFNLFQKYVFTVAEQDDNETDYGVDPEMLGRVLENLLAEQINDETKESARKSKGAFYTPSAIVNYMCDQTLVQYLNTKLNLDCTNVEQIITKVQNEKRNKEAIDCLENIKVLDPACGSGAFPIGFMNQTLKIIMRLDSDYDAYKKKKTLIEKCIFGVDIEPLAVEMTRLRCYLSLMIDANHIEALPNLDFKFICANSLIGLPRFADTDQNSFGIDGISEIYASKVAQIKNLSANLYNTHGDAANSIKSTIQTLCQTIHIDAKNNWQTMTNNLGGATDKAQIQMMTEQAEYWSSVEIFWRDIDFFDYSKPKPIFDSELMLKVKGFDAVIGNPPYLDYRKIDNATKKFIHSEYFVSKYNKQISLYSYFIEKGINTLKPQGVLFYINPYQFLSTDNYTNVRKLVIANGLTQIVDVSNIKVFESACAYTCILGLTKEYTGDISIKNCNQIKDIYSQGWSLKRSDANGIIQLNSSSSLAKIIKTKNTTTLKNLGVNVFCGTSSSGFGKKIIPTSDFDKVENKSEYVKIIQNGDFKKYTIDSISGYIPISVYSNNVQRELVKNEKLLLGRMSKTLRASVDYEKRFCGKVNVITNFRNYHLKLLLAIFNSKILNLYFQEEFESTHLSGGYLPFTTQQIEQLPIPILDTTHKQELARQIEVLVEQILLVKKESGETSELEAQIDQLVYQLYDLTVEEIGVVEG